MSTPIRSDNQSLKDDSSSPSSPTPTIRNTTPVQPPSASQVFAAAVAASPGPATGRAASQPGMNRRQSGQQQQQELGKGRPGKDDLRTAATPSQLRGNYSPARASISSTEDEDYLKPNSLPRTAVPENITFESTPRGWGGGSSRGVPQTAFGSSFGSPTAFFSQPAREASSGGTHRLGRSARFANSRDPSQTVTNPGGSSSRSTSRARPSLQHHHSILRDSPNLDDDELQDRGAELIKQRQRERKAKRKKLELEQQRRLAEEGTTPETSNPPSGVPEEGFAAQQGGLSRRPVPMSRIRNPSATRRPTSEGFFPYPPSISDGETPRDGGMSPKEDARAPSVYSSVADDEAEDQLDERVSIVGEIVNDVVEEETGGDVDKCGSDEEEEIGPDEGVTMRDRQDAINIEHPFGLPIWKPALYRKSRSVTRNAESALHSIPSAAAERHLLPGNILWTALFGWWLAIACFIAAVLVSGVEVLGGGRGGYGKTLRGLAWYIGWPFGKYVEGEGAPDDDHEHDEHADGDEEQANGNYQALDGSSPISKRQRGREVSDSSSSNVTVRRAQDSAPVNAADCPDATSASTVRANDERPAVSFASGIKGKGRDSVTERSSLLGKNGFRRPRNKRAKKLGQIVYWPGFCVIVAPTMLLVCVLCWGFVITIPMAKLTWELLNLLWYRPLEINFRPAPRVPVPIPTCSSDNVHDDTNGSGSSTAVGDSPTNFTLKRARLTAGQVAPTSGPTSTVLLCTYRAVGLQYYKYTVGGVNIMFINLLPLVFFTIIDGLLLLPAVERKEHLGKPITPLLRLLTSQALLFVLALASVIPLSYFIGMAVASISAQSSIGMGAVINATFGSIIEIILYSIALTQGKGRLVEGSIVGSILAGVLLMPGASMCSGAFKRKEQKFNAKSAGVTSTMLIMAIIGTLTPTMFYQTYGSFELHCQDCPSGHPNMTITLPEGGMSLQPGDMWMCDHCYYEHPDPERDPFYQENVKTLMYACAAILLFSYLIGLWFSLRTHAAQIWQNPQQLMKSEEAQAVSEAHPALKTTLAQRVTPQALMQHVLPLHKSNNPPATSSTNPVVPVATNEGSIPATVSPKTGTLRLAPSGLTKDGTDQTANTTPGHSQQSSHANGIETSRPSPNTSQVFTLPAGYTPYFESIDQATKSNLTPVHLPGTLTTEDFTRAVAVATVSALRHQGSIVESERKRRHVGGEGPAGGEQGGGVSKEEEGHGKGGGHEAPSWTRGASAGVLLACTMLYAIIAEILVDVVDVVLHGSGIDEKFLGLTLFALVPNTTEFMNAMSFALNGNIALSMEIGSAYALQVCLLQIPAMVAFSALYQPEKMGDVIDTFTLIFPRWDVIAIILSIFLLTYTYIEARSNYHRGSILVLAYIVLIMGFYYAPPRAQGGTDHDTIFGQESLESFNAGWTTALTKLWV
ncbi:calcium/proton exchanger [Cryptococcus neoformans c45]|nr:calcium/proton exchanger [Cryptococcus neoformans var. grubii c45]